MIDGYGQLYLQVKQISGHRSSIAVPQSSWGAFRDVLGELMDKMTAAKNAESGGKHTATKSEATTPA